jgi:hypothetical protein
VNAADHMALARLRKWSNPRQGGNPTKRMHAIWGHPIELARDIQTLLRVYDCSGYVRPKQITITYGRIPCPSTRM